MPVSRPRRSKVSRHSPGAMTAAAERLADRLATKSGSTVGEHWQALALDMYDAVPELRAAARITGQAMSQCRLVIARVTDGEPAPLAIGLPDAPGPDADHPAQKLLESFAGGQGGQAAWLDMLGVHLTVTGESISVGAIDTVTPNDNPLAEWAAYSPQQVVARNSAITVKMGDTLQSDEIVDEEVSGVTAVRIWRPHPRFNWQADSAARAAMSVMEEIVLYDQHVESSAISRLISAGVFAVPDGMTLPGLPAEEDSDDVDVDPFMRFLMQVMSTAIKDRKSAAARVPILIRGDKEDIAAMKHFDFSTGFDAKVEELRHAAIKRLAVAVDMPAALLTGLEDTQHWSGALITQDWVNNYLQALLALVCGSLTSGWLHKALALTQGAEDYSNIIVWFDSSQVRVRENIGPETQWAWENRLVSDDTARRILGFDDSDIPSPEEFERNMLIAILHKAPVLAPLIFPLLGIKFTPEQLLEADALGQAIRRTSSPEVGPEGQVIPTAPGGAQQPSTSTSSPSGGIPAPSSGQKSAGYSNGGLARPNPSRVV